MTDEKRLLTGLKKGRRGSLEKVIDIYTSYVSVIVYNVIGKAMSKEDIEEAVADVFVSLWKNAGNLDDERGSIRAYLAKAAKSRAVNKLREATNCGELNENIISAGETPEEDFEKKEEREMFIELIKNLGEPDSEIFMRFYYYDEKISQIASVTGIQSGTVKSKLARGRKKLKDMLMKRRYGNG